MICNGLIDTYKTANMFLLTPVILRYNMVSNNIVPLQTSSLFHSAGVSIIRQTYFHVGLSKACAMVSITDDEGFSLQYCCLYVGLDVCIFTDV